MHKHTDCTTEPAKRRKQVSLDLPRHVEEHLNKKAEEGFRSFSSEIAMRLTRSVEVETTGAQQ